jgi:hypothetical protein
MARSTLAALIARVRSLTATGTADYSIGATQYWSDDQIAAALDRNRQDVVDEPLRPVREISAAGSATYRLYEAQCRWLETSDGGTAVLYLRSSTGARVGTAQYTPDYESGRFAFAADTGGSVLYLTARAYDVQAAAADVWQQKAAHVADRFDFSADGASFKASQLVAQYERQAAACAAQASFGAAGVQSITLMRDDVRGVWD